MTLTEATTVTIKNGDFTASINLAATGKLTLEQWKKLVRLATTAPYESDNQEALEKALAFLRKTIAERKGAAEDAKREYNDCYVAPQFILDRKARRSVEIENRKLLKKVKSAKHQLSRWERRLNAILEDKYYET